MAAQSDIIDQIEWPAVEGLNQHADHQVTNALKQGYREDDGLYLESDTDEQLLLHIPFTTAIKLHSIIIKSTHNKDQAPRRIKLFINRPTLSFSDAADLPATQELELTDKNLEGEPIQLRFVKFQRVNVLSIFVEGNQGDEDTTIIQKIVLTGSGGDSLNVKEIKKVDDDQ